MAVTRVKTWIANEILASADLNAEFDNLINNGQSVGFPRTSAADFDGQTLILDADGDTTVRASTDDQIDIAIGGTDTFQFTATQLTILGRRVLTTTDKASFDAMIPQIGTLRARVASIESKTLAMNQMTNF